MAAKLSQTTMHEKPYWADDCGYMLPVPAKRIASSLGVSNLRFACRFKTLQSTKVFNFKLLDHRLDGSQCGKQFFGSAFDVVSWACLAGLYCLECCSAAKLGSTYRHFNANVSSS